MSKVGGFAKQDGELIGDPTKLEFTLQEPQPKNSVCYVYPRPERNYNLYLPKELFRGTPPKRLRVYISER